MTGLISTTTGLREHIKNGYEDWEETQDGNRIWFYYRNNQNKYNRQLLYICSHPITFTQLHKIKNACKSKGIFFSYTQNNIAIYSDQKIVLTFITLAGQKQVKKIIMPSLSSDSPNNQQKNSKIIFNYDVDGGFPWLLHSINYPTGLTNKFLYNNETSRTNFKTSGLSVGINNAKIPVVTELITHDKYTTSNNDQHTWYSYNLKGMEQHNYTGYQHNTQILPGKDNLIDRSDNYHYSTMQDNGFTRKITIYNKYHLPLQETEISNKTNLIIGKSIISYPNWKNTTFNNLSATYSLPTKITKTFFTINNGLNSVKKVTREALYNSNGQPIWKRNTSG